MTDAPKSITEGLQPETRKELGIGPNERPLEMPHQRVMCLRHALPFQPRWPLGYPVFTVQALQAVVQMPAFLEDCRRLGGLGADELVDVRLIEAALDAKPACCRVQPAVLVRLYHDTKVGRLGRCDLCRKRDVLGTPLKAVNIKLRHLCFSCLVFDHRLEVRANPK